jgi:hypothetical protein
MAATDVRCGDGLLIQPLPWRAEWRLDLAAVIDCQGVAVLGGVTRDEANFIVTACNSHYDLLACCKLALEVHPDADERERRRDIVRAAIARAEGR